MSGKCPHCRGLTPAQAIRLAAGWEAVNPRTGRLQGIKLRPRLLWNWVTYTCPILGRKLRAWPNPDDRKRRGRLLCECDLRRVLPFLLPEPPPHEWADRGTRYLSFERLGPNWPAKSGRRYAFSIASLWRWARDGWADIEGNRHRLKVRQVYFVGVRGRWSRRYLRAADADALLDQGDRPPKAEQAACGVWLTTAQLRAAGLNREFLMPYSDVADGKPHRVHHLMDRLLRTRVMEGRQGGVLRVHRQWWKADVEELLRKLKEFKATRPDPKRYGTAPERN